MRRFVVGDIHGGNRALIQVLQRASFDEKHDLLISLGDLCDGWPETKACVETVLSLPYHVFILGNHDRWFLDWLKTGRAPYIWTSQGGQATLDSYRDGVPAKHKRFFKQAPFFHIIDDKVFVHAGLDPRVEDMSLQVDDVLLWDRSLFGSAYKYTADGIYNKFGKWGRIYVGHTTLTTIGRYEPTLMCNVMAMDTGAGWEGKLSLMDIDSGDFWQSDKVADLYAGVEGR